MLATFTLLFKTYWQVIVMTDRLEEIIQRDEDNFYNKTVTSLRTKRDIEWLISRMEKLEEVLEKLTETQDEIWDERIRYKQALEYYADEKNHEAGKLLHKHDDGTPVHDGSKIDYDFGEVARQALKGESE